MGRDSRSPQNDEVPSVAPVRQRPEEILAQTLTAPRHPEATDGWSSRGRRIFLIAMAVAGVLLVVAGLLVTKELAPGAGNPAPLETGPGNGLAGQLLKPGADQPPSTQSPNGVIAVPLAATPTTHASVAAPGTSPAAQSAAPTPKVNDSTTPTTAAPQPTTTTVPCAGILGQSLQSTQLLPCRAGTGLPLP
jgi:hypothetical protein